MYSVKSSGCLGLKIVVTLAVFVLASCSEDVPPRPNILLILADDLGYNDLSLNNTGETATPNIDALALEGTRFSRFFADSTCSPARAALMSGMYASRVGFKPTGRGLTPELVTLAELLKQAGYRTHHVGKWHLGDSIRSAWPDRQGFDSYFGFHNQWELNAKEVDGLTRLAKPTYYNPLLRTNGGPLVGHNGHLTDILAKEVSRSIWEFKGKTPWFVNYWTYAPHTPIEPPASAAAQFDDTVQGRLFASLSALDDGIGLVLAALQESGQLENTLVIFASDNGGTQRHFQSNAPLLGAKMSYLPGGIRTPLIFRWPGVISEAQINHSSVAIQDIYPTIAALLGLKLPTKLDGIDISRAFAGEQLESRNLFWESDSASTRNRYGAMIGDKWWLAKSPTWGLGSFDAQLYELQDGLRSDGNALEASSQTFKDIYRKYQEWNKDVNRVSISVAQDLAGSGTASGSQNLRTPGFDGFTFGIGIELHNEDAVFHIARQGELWSLNYLGKDKIQLQMGSLTIPVVLSDSEYVNGECRSIVISGYFKRKTFIFASPPGANLSIYVDGKRVASEYMEGELEDEKWIPYLTELGNDLSFSDAKLGRPIILSDFLLPAETTRIAELHDELCRAL